ncbi:APC family permease [Rhodococcus sp. NPDC060176]|uniref:APC family permease n=1 Tax=Rhodococcus sp. NPDC060176 TaxID=3347062 RepID=UPI0036650218
MAGDADVADAQGPALKRVMGVSALVVFGVAYMAPMVVFTTFGVVNQVTDGHVPTAYVLTTAAMLFTAMSYAMLVRAYPVAGSAYAYSRRAFGGHVGFLTGWALMLDYLLLPLTNYLLFGIYLNAEFPEVPAWVYSVGMLALITVLSIVGIGVVRNANLVLVGIQVIFVILFSIVAVIHLMKRSDVPLLEPIYSHGMSATALFAGAATLSLAFLGFDAVSTMSEEARDPRRTVPRAILLTVVVGAVLFIVVSYISTLIVPDPASIPDADSASVHIMGVVAGQWFQSVFLVAYLSAGLAAGLATQVSVSRVLYAMGRDGVLPRSVFAKVSRRFRTPFGAALFVAVLSFVGLRADLGWLFSVVNFGALAAFSLVNMSVVKHFLIDRRERGLRNLLRYGVSPTIGFLLTLFLWFNLSGSAFRVGLCWLGIGVIYLLWLTRGFRRPPPDVNFDDTAVVAETPEFLKG